MDTSQFFKSSLGIKYPTLRDHPLHTELIYNPKMQLDKLYYLDEMKKIIMFINTNNNQMFSSLVLHGLIELPCKSNLAIHLSLDSDRLGEKWLEGKRIDDGAEGYWRIHDGLYDLNNFIESHPGGRDWLELTKGTDITEAFESHHLTSKAERLLPKLFVKKATTPRTFPFTFHENGFYKTLKRKIAAKLETLPKKSATRSKLLTDGIFASYVTFFLLAVYFRSFIIGVISGLCLGLLAVAAHNFFHQKNNYRRFYFDFSMMSSREWRISHVLSHHMYTNTISDMEISSVEPFFQYLPGKKNVFFRYGSWVYGPLVYALLFIVHFLKTLVQGFLLEKPSFPWPALLPFTLPILSWIVTNQPAGFCILMFIWIITIGSLHFSIVGINAAHHHPDIFHDGDAGRPKTEMDWGIFELDTVMDRKDITGSHFLVLTNFGDHALHHLFPTIDHELLEHLYPVFLDTCKVFGVDWRLVSQLDLIKGQYRQLAKVIPKTIVPKMLAKS